MNNEIKQIIEDIKLTLDVTVKDMVLLNRKDIKQLLDCITNLQQEKDSFEKIANQNYKVAEDYKSRCEKAVNIAYEYSQIDGDHHKTWCIDQIVRALTDNNYNEFVKEYENNGEYKWNVGIAP